MSRLTLLTSLLFIFFFQGVQAQIVSEDEEIERQLLASTKQLNQFFNRFNGEEDTKGRKFEPDDRQYRSERIRKRYLSILFDEENAEFSEDLLKTFIEQVTNKDNPQFLSLRSPEWFAVVNTTFKYKGKEEPLTLYMQIQQEGLGYEWVISDLVFEPYNTLFDKQRGETKEFLHPMSHELDFMNLRKALVKGGSPESYTLADFKPDLLTVFLYEVKMGLLEFQTVNRLNFHFFSIDGWYFQLNNFNRPGYNTGWLISDLAQVNDSQKEALLKIIYDKSKFIYAFVALLFSFSTLAQEVDTEADPYVGQAEGMVQTLSYYFNLLGAEKTSLAEREIIINNSYKKLFLNEKVQVEDDLQDDRSTVIYKDVQAYLKDIDFFFTEAAFGFEIEKIERLIKEDETPYYKVELLRNLKGASVAGDSINSTKKRYIEFNFDKNDELKIASIYTNKVSRDKQLREWWNGLTLEWRNIFQDKIGVYFDSLSNVELLSVVSIDSLDLSGNDLIRDIDPIYQLTELKYLKLSDTFVSDLKPLLSINKLQSLDLSQSAVEDLEYLKYHTDIRSLNLSSSPIDTFDVLAAFGKLQKLRLDGTAQVNLQFVNNLKSIEWLSLADGQGLDSINFQQLRNLKYLDVSGSDLDSIAPLQRIEELNISDTGIKDLEFLRGATALKVLYLNNTEVSSLDAISALNSLERVYANGTRLDDAAIASFAAKNDALLVTNAAQLKEWWNGMPMNLRNALREYVSSSPTPEELSQLIRAEALDLTNINLIDITPLSRFQNLKSLTLDKNPVVNLPKSALSAELEKLSINETKVRDLSPLGDHPNLKVVYAKNTLVRNVEVLAGMPALAELDVDNTNVEEATVAALLDKKEQVKVRFMTEQLETWWVGVSQELKDKLLQTINKSGRVNSDDLHALVASKRLEFVGSGFNRQATTAIKRFYRLEELKVQRAGLSGLQLLPVIDELKSLELLEMPIADLSTLQQRYPKLERLVLTNTAVEDLRPLEGLITLQELNFSGTNVKRMRGLEELTELRYIDCSNTSVFRLDRLSELKKLERITCFNTGLRQNDIDKLLEYLPDLEVVYY